MYGSYSGSLPGDRVRKRPFREGFDESLESGPQEPPSEGPRSEDLRGYIRLLRGLIIQSVSDLGNANTRVKEREELVEFFDSGKFDEVCDYSCWESEWIRDVVRGILSLRPAVRHEMTRQSVQMMKTLASRG